MNGHDRLTRKELGKLDARVTALEVIVETLVVDALAEMPDPEAVARQITESAFDTDRKVRSEVGDKPSVMRVTEAISALFAPECAPERTASGARVLVFKRGVWGETARTPDGEHVLRHTSAL
jgi:hypothetical protein